MVAAEDFEEACLRAGRAFDAAKGQRRDPVVELRDVEHEVLHPESGALADGRRLRRLQVSRAKRRLGAPFTRERGESAKRAYELGAEQAHAAPHEKQIGV